jgi:hypothetical protein
VEVKLDRVSEWDLDYLAGQFKESLRDVLESLRPHHKGRGGEDDSEAGGAARRDSPELAFLRRVRPEIFKRDLRRYDLHMAHGLSFRLIALLESEGMANGEPREIPRQHLVRRKVRGESSVEDSVHRIYQAIYREPYSARRRRLDHPGQGASFFACPDHPGDTCDTDCRYLQDWLKKVEPTLPSDKTGMLPPDPRPPAR